MVGVVGICWNIDVEKSFHMLSSFLEMFEILLRITLACVHDYAGRRRVASGMMAILCGSEDGDRSKAMIFHIFVVVNIHKSEHIPANHRDEQQ